MATATGLTAERMLEIERASVVSARLENGELILTTRGGTDINVGDVTGSQGPIGPDGLPRYTWLKYADSPTSGMSDSPTNKNYIGLAYNKTSIIESNDYADYYWSLIRGPEGAQGVPGPSGENGEPTYVWIKYATDVTGSGMSDSPTNKDYIGFAYNKNTSVESSNPEDYSWSLIKGPKGDKGDDGAQGIPGPAGANGEPLYTWVKYADSPTAGISDDPTGKDYIGLAYNKGTATESTNYSDYAWSLIKGPQGAQGVPGTPGADGLPRYVWIKYANDISGSGISDDPTGKDYIGLAYNKTTAVESNEPLDYTWSLYKGPAGNDGEDGRGIISSEIAYQASASGVLVPTGTWLTDPPTVSAGQYLWTRTKTTYNSAPYDVLSYSVGQMGQTGPAGANGTTITAAVVRYQLHTNGTTAPTGTWLSTPPSGSPGQWLWTRTVTSYSSGADTIAYSISLLGQTGPQGTAGTNGIDGRGITSSEITYQAASSGTVAPTGTWLSSVPSVSPSQFLWTRTRTFYSSAPTEVVSYSVGQMGATGVQGNQGIQGPAGTSYYTWLKYADSPTSGMSDDPTGKTYIGLAHNKTTATESNIYSDYTWALIKGEQGIQGLPGADGQPTYTWIKYGTSSTGAGISDDPTGKTYIGIAYNKTTIVESSNAADYSWSLIQGATGAPGESVTGQTVDYQLSSSGTVIPTGTWVNNPPAGSPGQYMWTRITFTYTTLPNSHAYSVSMLGNTGPTGATGAAGTPAAIITLVATSQVLRSPATGGGTTPLSVTITGSTLNTTISVYEYSVDGSAFSTTVPAGVSRTGNVVTIIGSTMTASTIAVRMADSNGVAQSVTVSKIYDGAIGPTGNTGRGISSTDISYQASSSGTVVPTGTWVSSPPVVSAGQYLWTRTVFNYTTGSPSSTTHYSVGGMGSKIDTVTVAYQLSNSGTVAPSGTWTTDPQIQTESLPYLWTRTITTYVGGPSTTTAYSVSRRGISVSSVEMIYKEFAPKLFNSFEEQSNDLVEVIRNVTLNPEAISSGSTTESLTRFGWTRTNITESNEILRPESRLASYFRHTVGTGSVGGGRGIDWYQNMGVAPVVTNGPQVVAGKTYLISYYTRFSRSATATLLYRIHNGTTWLDGGTLKTLTIGTSWTRVYAVFTPTFSGSIAIRNQVDATGWTSTDYIDQTGLLICESSTLQNWFSGEYSSDNDLEPAWVGTINSSPSILKGHPTSPNFEQVGLTGIASIQWYKTGSKSYRLIPNSIDNNSYAGITLGDLGLEVGKTYTIFTTLKIFNPQTGSINSNARNISIGPSTVISNQAPNLAGEYLLTLVFTLDGISISLTSELMLNSGVTAGNGDIWYDDLIVIEGNVGLDVSTWISTMPSYNSDMILFRSEKVIFSDGSITYTAPKIEPLWSALNLANDARDNAEEALAILDDHSLTIYGNNDDTGGLVGRIGILENDTSSNPQTPLGALIRSIGMTADGKNTTIRSFDGAINPEKYIAGDQWYQYNTNGNIVNFWMHNGSEWVETRLNSAIFGDVDAAVINSGFIHADRIDLNSIPRDRIDNLPALLEELQDLNGSGDIAKTLQRLTSQIVIGDGVIQIIAPSTDVSTDLHMELDATELAFYQGTNKVSYINDNKMFIRNAEIASTIGDSLVLAAHDVFKGGLGSLEGKVTVFRSI